jgi:hypothetical protein
MPFNSVKDDFKKEEEIATMRRKELQRKIEMSSSYDDLFETVKRVVETEIGQHRAGLALVLTDMPNTVGAYHPVGSNSIVLNRALISAMKTVIKNEKEINTFVFMVLMHEYLHSLGYLDEVDVRKRCYAIAKNALGPDHIAPKMAIGNWLEMYPQLSMIIQRLSPNSFERVDKFDSSSMSYIG